MANAPLSGRDGKSCSLIFISEKQKYFFERDWTGQISLIRLNKSDFSHGASKTSKHQQRYGNESHEEISFRR
jgi:hypothetical protein